jgi:hypothetical protein
MSCSRRAFSIAIVLAGTCAPAIASAQSIAASGTGFPARITPASSPAPTRPENLNPNGVNYTDCTADMTLQFPVLLDGFTGNASVEVWASLASTYCTANTDRGIGSTAAACWQVSQPLVIPNIATPQTTTFSVRVQDLVGWQASPPPPSSGLPASLGAEACTAQSSFAAVPMHINFLAVDEDGNSVGTPYSYQINTDLVGPPAPADVCETVGDTIFNVTWNPNADSDTIGYVVYIDPIPGQEPAGDGLDSGVGKQLADGGGCGSAASTASCADPVLVGGIIASGGGPEAGTVDSGTTDTGTTTDAQTPDTGAAQVDTGAAQVDASGSGDDSGVAEGPGGIGTIPSQYAYSVQSYLTVQGQATSSYQIKGLVNYDPYTVVISSVDGSGNTGPPSPQVCDYPAPIQDFWEVCQQENCAKGGFCALETVGVGGTSLAGVGIGLAIAAGVRRRRRRRA